MSRTLTIESVLPGAIVRLPNGRMVGVCGKTGEKGARQMLCTSLGGDGLIPLETPVTLVHSNSKLMLAMLKAEAKRAKGNAKP